MVRGDKVICIRPEIATPLQSGEAYTVALAHHSRPLIKVDECPNGWFYDKNRFALAKGQQHDK